MFSSGLKGVIYLFKVIIKFQNNPKSQGQRRLFEQFIFPILEVQGDQEAIMVVSGMQCHGNSQYISGLWETRQWNVDS